MNPKEERLYAVAHAADQRTENAPTPPSKAKAHSQAYDAYEKIAEYHEREAIEAQDRATRARDMANQHLHQA